MLIQVLRSIFYAFGGDFVVWLDANSAHVLSFVPEDYVIFVSTIISVLLYITKKLLEDKKLSNNKSKK